MRKIWIFLRSHTIIKCAQKREIDFFRTFKAPILFGVEYYYYYYYTSCLFSSSQSLLTCFSFINLLLLFLPLCLCTLLLPPLLGWPDANLRLFPTRWLIYHYIITASLLLHPDVTRRHTTLELFQYSCIITGIPSLFSKTLSAFTQSSQFPEAISLEYSLFYPSRCITSSEAELKSFVM